MASKRGSATSWKDQLSNLEIWSSAYFGMSFYLKTDFLF